jgi:hypothetical protein
MRRVGGRSNEKCEEIATGGRKEEKSVVTSMLHSHELATLKNG